MRRRTSRQLATVLLVACVTGIIFCLMRAHDAKQANSFELYQSYCSHFYLWFAGAIVCLLGVVFLRPDDK
jgi:hypothetical protein